ncbi:TPA: restriction endonuclease subunit S [Streptococcus suis 14A]|uniref:restriction endonuclease subunit S n=1 Tax=Streptococcus suis TaxID=1307 RepID=UPI0003FBCB64|nr:restriction endonuclease subunit S [Streptococcus suis]HEM3198650.1 restriction endonuclease subunit S [Streptococcus suis 14A]
MTKEKSTVPRLRFPGFTDAWKQRKLGEFMKESKILGSKGDIARKLTVRLWGRGVVSKKEIYSGSSATQYYIRKSGQFIYGKLDFLNQAFGIIPPELDGYESTLDSPAFDLLKEINGQFLLEFVSRKEFYYYQGNIANGSRKAKRIHTETFLGMPISLPTLPEQEAIGSFFSDLDQLITLHQRKLDDIKELKKALLQKMFPKGNGNDFPELRFPEFTDTWKQRKFSDLAEVRRGLTYSPSAIRSHGVRVLRSSNINEDTFVFGEDDVFVDKSVVKIPLVKEGDILITSANGSSRLVGKHSIIKGLPSNSAIHGGFMLLASSKVPCFLNAFMSSTWYHKFIGLYVAGGNGAIGNLNKSDLDEQIVLVPTLPEQEAIGSFFSGLDQLITLHQRQLDHLKLLKKALLQQMFI